MANPQKEDGYTPIANELLEALAGIRIAGEARQCLDVILRKTYGFQKKEDKISLSQFTLITHLGKSHVCRNLNKLASMNIIITQKGNDNITSYRFNKDFTTWKPLPKKVTITQKGNEHYPKRKSSLPKKGHTKETITKETITKERIQRAEHADDTQKLFQVFYENGNPAISWENRTSRAAAKWLVDHLGREKAVRAAEYACSIQGQQYAPTITTPYQLKEKLAALIVYQKKNQPLTIRKI